MKTCFPDLGRYSSIFDRLMRMYYDRGLSEYEIGWGQQFYVEYIYDHPGATPQEMASYIRVDKATLTKSMKKLSEIGYIRIAVDEKDRRIRHLYLTDAAVPAAEQIKKIHGEFYRDFSADILPQDLELTEKTLQKMADNINRRVWHRMEVSHEK